MDLLRKVYSNKPSRIIIKLIICTAWAKVMGDAFFCLFYNLRFTYPRSTYTQGPVQSPLNPPFDIPYPYQVTSSQVDQNRKLDDIYDRMTQNSSHHRDLQIITMYNDQPERQNRNKIDYYLKFAQSSRLIEVMQAKALRKINESGIDLNEGINKKLRSLDQWKFKGYSRIQPIL